MHFNVLAPHGSDAAAFKAEFEATTSMRIYDAVVAMGGSFSAEYGIGRTKLDLLKRYGDPGKLHLMKIIKAAVDPQTTMSPGKVVR